MVLNVAPNITPAPSGGITPPSGGGFGDILTSIASGISRALTGYDVGTAEKQAQDIAEQQAARQEQQFHMQMLSTLVSLFGKDAVNQPAWNESFKGAFNEDWPTVEKPAVPPQMVTPGGGELGTRTPPTYTPAQPATRVPMPLGGKQATLGELFHQLQGTPYENLTVEQAVQLHQAGIDKIFGMTPPTVQEFEGAIAQKLVTGQPLTPQEQAFAQSRHLLLTTTQELPKTFDEAIIQYSMEDMQAGKDPMKDPRIQVLVSIKSKTSAAANKPMTPQEMLAYNKYLIATGQMPAPRDPDARAIYGLDRTRTIPGLSTLTTKLAAVHAALASESVIIRHLLLGETVKDKNGVPLNKDDEMQKFRQLQAEAQAYELQIRQLQQQGGTGSPTLPPFDPKEWATKHPNDNLRMPDGSVWHSDGAQWSLVQP